MKSLKKLANYHKKTKLYKLSNNINKLNAVEAKSAIFQNNKNQAMTSLNCIFPKVWISKAEQIKRQIFLAEDAVFQAKNTYTEAFIESYKWNSICEKQALLIKQEQIKKAQKSMDNLSLCSFYNDYKA